MTSKPVVPPKERIMDVAERLFARSGFDGVSVREITQAAEVRLASVNYYFETKENLYVEVLTRRAIVIVNERLARYRDIDFSRLNKRQAITAITVAIVEPLIQKLKLGDPGWTAFLGMIANYAAKPLANGIDAPPMNEIDKTSLVFINALQQYSTDNDARRAHHAFQFITGACLMMFSNNGRLNTLSEDRYRSDDYQAIHQDAIDFIVGGAVTMLVIENPKDTAKDMLCY